ncbi:MAG: SGNH/GDSL hydrolase family protein [Rhodospirillales bacterium]
MSRIAKALVVALYCLLLLEGFSAVATHLGLLLVNDRPAYSLDFRAMENGLDWRTEGEAWGAWHKPSRRDRHAGACFAVDYVSNAAGARDSEFAPAKTPGLARYLLIGDSFAEGYGVAIADTVQAVIEREAGVEVYNLGASGDLGPVQYDLLYRHFAPQFDHDGVIVLFFPGNDFTDNDPAAAKWAGSTRWRPYYRREGDGGYSIFYPEGAARSGQVTAERPGTAARIQHFLLGYTYSMNTVRTVWYLLVSAKMQNFRYAGYFDAVPEQQEAALHFLDRTVAAAAGKPVHVVVVPDARDLARLRAGAGRADLPWHAGLQRMAAAHPSLRVHDLAGEFVGQEDSKMFLSCDPHWSAAGHAVAGRAIARAIGR